MQVPPSTDTVSVSAPPATISRSTAVRAGIVILASIIGAPVLTMGFVFTYGLIHGRDLDASSKAYAEEATKALVTNWDMRDVKSRAGAQFWLAAESEEDVADMLKYFSKLGKLKEDYGAHGQALIQVNVPQGLMITAHYVSQVEFETGPGRISINLARHGDGWELAGFRVDSKALMKVGMPVATNTR